MKLYLSHSMSKTDLHVASMLSRQAQAKGIIVDSSRYQSLFGSNMTVLTTQSIKSSDILIAIVSKDNKNIQNVQLEIGYAAGSGKLVLALVEKGAPSLAYISQITEIVFDRNNLRPALSKISEILEARKNQEDTNKWIVAGGLALLALYIFGGEK
jgi:nucleoside 2-deoxyribosyltransferase